MAAVALYGLLITALSVWMVARPGRVAELGLRYCRWRWMHPVEILLCIGFGAAFVFAAERSGLPAVLRVFGYLLLAVGGGLVLTPPSLHRRFGIWSIEKTGRFLRLAGVGSLGFGIFLLYVALS